MIRFTVPGPIATKGSTRAIPYRRQDGRLAAHVLPDNPRARRVQNTIAWCAREELARHGGTRFPSGVQVRIYVYLVRPASVSAKARPLPTVKPDLDKIARLVLDALTGVVYDDDASVCTLTIWKRYVDAVTRAHVTVEVEGDQP